MKVIGHRGAAGLALENTIESIKAAVACGVDVVEFDIRLTQDNKLVVCHNADLWHVGSHEVSIATTDYKQLRKYKLHNGEPIASLTEALRAAAGTPVLVEIKGSGWASTLIAYMRQRDTNGITIIAQDQHELAQFHAQLPDVPIYLVQRFNPVDVLQAIRDAHNIGCNGVDLNFWLLTPYTYWLARHYKLDIIVYTINSALLARFVTKLFPGISITTNHPDRLKFLQTQTLTDRSS